MEYLAHKIELRPTAEQEEYFRQACGIRRFIFNQCLAQWVEASKKGLKPDVSYIMFFYSCLREKYPWLKKVSARVGRCAVNDLIEAFKRFFKNGKGFPKFKKKGVQDSFSIREKEKFAVLGRSLRVEKLRTHVKLRQQVRFRGQPKEVTISKRAGKWFASVVVKLSANPFASKRPCENQVGVDLGVKEMAVLSDGTVFPASQPLKKYLKKLAKLQRMLSRKVKGSKRWSRIKLKIQKLYYRISCIRAAVIHEFTDYVTKTFKLINIEDLNVSGLVKNHRLARAVSDVGFYEIRKQLEYKSNLRGCKLNIVDRWFPSSKMCSACGRIKEDLTLLDRVFVCDCGFVLDRDLNAAINIKNYSLHTARADLKCSQELGGCC